MPPPPQVPPHTTPHTPALPPCLVLGQDMDVRPECPQGGQWVSEGVTVSPGGSKMGLKCVQRGQQVPMGDTTSPRESQCSQGVPNISRMSPRGPRSQRGQRAPRRGPDVPKGLRMHLKELGGPQGAQGVPEDSRGSRRGSVSP